MQTCAISDTSKTAGMKIVPVKARYFVPQAGVQVSVFNIKSAPKKTSQILRNHLQSITKEYELTKKVAAAASREPETTQ
jgi:hypothetical protein